jgi:hypothetical protein
MTDFDTMWRIAVDEMINAIKSDNNIYDFFITYEPRSDTGYAFSQDPRYKQYSDILDHITSDTGHSGSSFACCVRDAVTKIREEIVVLGQPCPNSSNEDDLTILEPL